MSVLLGFLQNMGDPYYQPTIVVHDKMQVIIGSTSTQVIATLQADVILVFTDNLNYRLYTTRMTCTYNIHGLYRYAYPT